MTAAAFAAAELTVEQGSYNFGSVAQGKKVQHNFVIKNSGDAPLQIKQLNVSCGCTAATPSSSQIPPGKTAEIKVVFDSTNFAGKVQKSVAMVTNAAKNPNYNLIVEGTVLEELQVGPRQVSLGQVKAGSPREVSVTVTNNGTALRRLVSVSANSNSLQIKATIRKAEVKPGEAGVIDLVITPRSEARVFSGYLHIITDSVQKKEITVPIYGSPAK